MPKLRPRSRPAPTPDDYYREALAGNLARLRIESNEEAMEMCGMARGTFYKRKNSPATMSLGELRRVAKAFGFDARQICAIIGVSYEKEAANG